MCLDLFFLLLIISGLWENENTREVVCAYSGGYPFSISGDIRSVPS